MKKLNKNNRINIRRIKIHETYSRKQISETLNIHIDTIKSWSTRGLNPINSQKHPFEYRGKDIHNFLRQKIEMRKRKCLDNEMFCVRCQVCTIADTNKKIWIEEKDKQLGPNAKHVIIIIHLRSTRYIGQISKLLMKGNSYE